MTNALTTQTETTALVVAPRQQFSLSPQNFDQALTFSNYLADSDLVPKDFKGKPANCLIALQWGAEIGLQPLQAIQNIAVINGRPALWGDAVIAIVRGSPLCEYVIEDDNGDTATCRVKRRGEPEQLRTFSMADAKAAGLIGKQGPWSQYPRRMRQMRARAFALRDVFPDVLRGLPVAEEVMDTPTERHMGPAEVVGAPPAAPKFYDPADFDKNFPTWSKAIAAGKKTAAEVIQTVETKALLTDEQKAKVLSVKVEATDVQPKEPSVPTQPAMTYAAVADHINQAGSLDDLAAMDELIGAVENGQHREELAALLAQRRDELPF